ncbi:MAG: phosphotransferase family protein [Desulfobacteraceae bacterium]|jgi:aminoglycoside phosphotransferase (APT) family kinase protein
MDYNDKAKEIRKGEELELKVLEAYLKDTIAGLSGTLEIQQFPSGFSNLTYLINVGETEMVLRRPPIGANIKSAHDMGREHRILTSLRPVYPYCPKPLTYTEDPSIMGCPFYVMERIPGVILRKNIPKGMDLPPASMRKLCEKLLDVHVELHSIDVKAVGLENLGKPQGFVKRQIEGWSERYRKARTPDAPDYEDIMGWLADKMQKDTDKPTIVHNDYKFDNVVLDPKDPMNIIGVLDWEMATYGDPLLDLGNSLAYWVEKNDPDDVQLIRMMPTNVDGALTRIELIERYGEKTGRDMKAMDFYFCFGMFRLAVIAQQIYKRFYEGITLDERFALLIVAVQVLEKQAKKIIEQSKL